jgi:hypothetical protein
MQYNMAKSYFLKAIVLLLSVVIFSQSGIAEENIPLLPMTVQGVVLEHGSPAPEGTIVVAYIDGEAIEETSVGSSGNYCLWISGNAETEGKNVTFAINGKMLGNALTWKSGSQILNLELNTDQSAETPASKQISIPLTNINSLGGPEKKGLSEGKSEVEIIENAIPEPNLKLQENVGSNSTGQKTKVSGNSSVFEKASGFPVAYALAGIILITFSFRLGAKTR